MHVAEDGTTSLSTADLFIFMGHDCMNWIDDIQDDNYIMCCVTLDNDNS